jgi:serpin B
MEKPHPEIFYKEDGTQVEVDMVSDTAMINKERSYNVAEPGWYSDVYEDDSVQVFAKRLKKYDESQLEFVAIMPKKQTLSDYLKSLRITQINELRNKAKPISEVAYNSDGKTKAFIKIPKFKFNTDLNLKNDLIKLGLTDVFGANSNLSKMQNIISSEKLYVDDAKHKADIEFTEEGIKAAATTVLGGGGGGGEGYDYKFDIPIKEIDITFDKPYMFVIRDKKTGEVWFTGTVYEPWDINDEPGTIANSYEKLD